MYNQEMRDTVTRLMSTVKALRHEYITIEHLLLAIITSDTGYDLIKAVGANPDTVSSDISAVILNNVETVDDVNYDPKQTAQLTELFDAMMLNAVRQDLGAISILQVLVAILRFKESVAKDILERHGATVDALLKASRDITDIETDDAFAETALGKYSVNLNKVAAKGLIDPIIGREDEISIVIQTLSRRKKNNPILVGDPGVGKTAIAEGLALRIHQDDVPKAIKDTQIYALNIGALVAGTKYRGDFEKRIDALLKQMQGLDNAILFIDEIHLIIGTGAGGKGGMDAANLLKPALASGKLRCMGSTTHAEYRNVFDKDKALSRRFTKVLVGEPSHEESVLILKGLSSKYEAHHEVTYTEDAFITAVELSTQYIANKFLPDIAIDLIDEAGAYCKSNDVADKVIDKQQVEDIVSRMLGIPISSMGTNDLERLKTLEDDILSNVIGQDNAVELVSRAVKRSRAGLNEDNKPIASFLFSGPTGVGKTELAKTLANTLGIHFERFDMSEYMEKHAVSRLVGAPPGYVGFDQGGLLTEAVKHHPYMVLLLDEIEKAHPDLTNILLQVMDNAALTDNNGYTANFQNVIVIMTSNVGAEKGAPVMGFNADDSHDREEALKAFFSPEFRNRLDAIVEFGALSLEVVGGIVGKFVNQLNRKLEPKGVSLVLTDAAVDYFADKGYDPDMGARPLNRLIQDEIKNPLTDMLLFGGDLGELLVDIVDGDLTIERITIDEPEEV